MLRFQLLLKVPLDESVRYARFQSPGELRLALLTVTVRQAWTPSAIIATGFADTVSNRRSREFGMVRMTRVLSRVTRYVIGPEIVMYAATGAACL